MLSIRTATAPVLLLAVLAGSCTGPAGDAPEAASSWVDDAVFYQIFPERFRNGDPANDPERSSLDYLEYVPQSWQTSQWTKDWYALDPWERAKSEDVYASMFDRRFGGDIQGVIDQLPYLRDLGITAIWFNPVFAARSLHKYDGSSFHHIDPHFGPDPAGDRIIMARETHDPATWEWTAADRLFLEMVEQAHESGIRIVLDGVWNHTGRGFFAFEDIRSQQAASPYADWYHIEAFDDPETPEDEFSYAGWFGYEALPEFADNEDGTNLQEDVKAYIMASTSRWMDPDGNGDPTDGIDGWRLDVAQEVPIGFWQEWNAHVRNLNPQAYTVAEIWEPAATFIEEARFSAAMNYHAFSMPLKGFLVDGVRDADWFKHAVGERLEAWGAVSAEAQLNLIDSHDTPRLASMVVNRVSEYQGTGNENDYDSGLLGPRSSAGYDVGPPTEIDRAIMELAVLFQMTFVGSPIVYYGTEAGMWGADDPDDRKPMVWPDLAYEVQKQGPFGPITEAPVRFNEEWHAFYRTIISLHTTNPALSKGTVHWIEQDWHPMALAFGKLSGNDSLVVILNRSPETVTVSSGAWTEAGLADDVDILFGAGGTAEERLRMQDGEWVLPALSGWILSGAQAQ